MATDSCKNRSLKPGARFHETLASDWTDNYKRDSFRKRIEFVDSKLRKLVTPGSRWLDLGCGSGVITRRLRDLGATGEAVDGSPSMIEVARRNGMADAASGFEYEWVETVESLRYADESYDGVLCSSVIEYVENPDAVLDEIYRVLKHGGRLLASFANSRSMLRFLQHVARRLSRLFNKEVYAYLDVSCTTFPRKQLADELVRRDFELTALKGFDPIFPSWLTRIFPGSGSLLFVVATKK